MKKKLLALILMAIVPATGVLAQHEMTQTEAKNLIKTTSKKWVSLHDPSIVWEPNSKRYYIFGSHKAGAWTTDLQNWTAANPTWTPSANNQAFTTPKVKKVKKGGQEVDMPAFNAMEWSARTDAAYNIDGNMWAPDVVWNEKMQKWCMYLSINGDSWHSSIILLTSSNIQGPYQYQAPVVICGFQDSGHSYKDTDLELVIGQQSSLPSRYNVGSGWGRRWPHTIDPAVFYDEQGQLWMAYGSWSGGIWMLQLDEETGLRDYDVTYPSTGGSTDGVTSDPYFGKKVAGGYYVSGEGSYIEYVGGYYYLFVSYGFFDSVGGYVMRMFRSKNPDGPYVDAAGKSAIFDSYKMNYGANADNRGVKVMGAYADWGLMDMGELSQGHNSIIHSHDGRTYLVYHTRFDNGSEGHQVRVHQMFQTKTGWLVASPFEYNGEKLTDEDIATRELFSNDEIAGTYQVLVHKYAIDYKNREVVRPVSVTLTADGKVSGAYTGTWSRDEGTSYLKLTMGGITYNGVVFEQQMDKQTVKTVSFSALASSGVNVWGYRLTDQYALARQLNNQTVPVAQGRTIERNTDLYAMYQGDPNVSLTWTSSQPDIISDHGRYNPNGLVENTPVSLTARLEAGEWFWQQQYDVTAKAFALPENEGWKTGVLAHYGFDDSELANTMNASEKAELRRSATTTKVPVQEDDELQLRNGQVLHLSFGANGKESYAQLPNPFYGKALEQGATLSFWVRRTDDTNLWDAFYGFYDPASKARLYMTGNCYTGYNDNAGTYLDINHPNTVQPTFLKGTRWHLVTVVFNRSTLGVRLYVDGSLKSGSDKFAGKQNDKEVTARTGFDYNAIVDHLAKCQNFYLGYGSFWGSADAVYDDVTFHDRALEMAEVQALSLMYNRVYNLEQLNPASVPYTAIFSQSTTERLYDLQGRRIDGRPRPGLYIRGGKKYLIK